MPMYDLECIVCGAKAIDEILPYKRSGLYDLECGRCYRKTAHRRLPSLVSRYLGDRPHSPMVQGGKYDTMGYRRGKVPMPGIPDGWNDFSASQVSDFFQQRDWKEYQDDKKRVEEEDIPRRQRTKLIESGANIDIKNHPLPGDPKLT